MLLARPFAAAAASVLIVSAAAAAPQPSAIDILHKAVTADDSVSYSGTMTTIVYGRDRVDSTVVRLDHNAPSAWRIWYVAPVDAYGRLIISNEKVTYQYEASTNTVYSDEWSASAPPLAESIDAARVERNYRVESGPSTTVAGRAAHGISLTSKYSGVLVGRIWVDDQTDLILRRESYHADGSIASKSSFDNVRVVKSLPKELFDLSIPQGMRLVPGATFGKAETDDATLASSLPFSIARPASLPDGFTLDHDSVSVHDGIQTLQIVYDDGLRDFSLFENATARLPTFEGMTPKKIDVGGKDGYAADFGGETLVTWNAGKLNLTLVGDLTAKELAAVGASIKQ
ncbi:MAG TPA: sigma-E factor regulatory protein RseB domain-containing protein [Candidatus Eremiobacteraceae bacterium]|nr:sigma-E factor regulatory protein RseB domain-containing protein [Candidatus Eremiobacteraceae bacterium]